MSGRVSHGEYADGTDKQRDGRTPDRCVMLSAMDAARVINILLRVCAADVTRSCWRLLDAAAINAFRH